MDDRYFIRLTFQSPDALSQTQGLDMRRTASHFRAVGPRKYLYEAWVTSPKGSPFGAIKFAKRSIREIAPAAKFIEISAKLT
jgi:hypothetical protein